MFGKKKLNSEELTQTQKEVLAALRSSEGSEDEEWDESALSIEEIIEISQRPRILSQLTELEREEVSREVLRAYALRAEVIFLHSSMSDGALYYSERAAHGFYREGDHYVVWEFKPTYSRAEYEEMRQKMEKTLNKRRSLL